MSKESHVNGDSSLRNAYKLFLNFDKTALSSTLVMKLFNNSRKLFETEMREVLFCCYCWVSFCS